jgi:hypothetical protein
MSVDQDDHSGRPTICTMLESVAKVLEVIHKNHKQMIHVVCIGTVIRDMPAHFVRQTQREADCCNICAKAAD